MFRDITIVTTDSYFCEFDAADVDRRRPAATRRLSRDEFVSSWSSHD
jgi:hypothetical protein